VDVHWVAELEKLHVLSGLGYYEAATPRPHGLRGQLVLGGAADELGYSGGEGMPRPHMLRHTMKNAIAFSSRNTDWILALQ
jgi:hypothetical protein